MKIGIESLNGTAVKNEEQPKTLAQLHAAMESADQAYQIQDLKMQNKELQGSMEAMTQENLIQIMCLAEDGRINNSLIEFLKMDADFETLIGQEIPVITAENKEDVCEMISSSVENYLVSVGCDISMEMYTKEQKAAFEAERVAANAAKDAAKKAKGFFGSKGFVAKKWKSIKKMFDKAIATLKKKAASFSKSVTRYKKSAAKAIGKTKAAKYVKKQTAKFNKTELGGDVKGLKAQMGKVWARFKQGTKNIYEFSAKWLYQKPKAAIQGYYNKGVGAIKGSSKTKIAIWVGASIVAVAALAVIASLISSWVKMMGNSAKYLEAALSKLSGKSVNEETFKTAAANKSMLKAATFNKHNSALSKLSTVIYGLVSNPTTINTPAFVNGAKELGYSVNDSGEYTKSGNSGDATGDSMGANGWTSSNAKSAVEAAIKLANSAKAFAKVDSAIKAAEQKMASSGGADDVIAIDEEALEEAKAAATLAAGGVKVFLAETRVIVKTATSLVAALNKAAK